MGVDEMKRMRSIGFLMIVAVRVLWAVDVLAGTWNVAAGGSDAGDGTAARPFATLARARDALRGRAKGEAGTVVMHSGTYVLTEPLELDAADSGTTWRAVENEEVRLSGGPVLKDDDWRAVTDEKVLKRLNAKARG